jgi:CarD family transcriptional regulator
MQAPSIIQFKVGDKAVYPAQGVAEVIDIEEKDIAGTRQCFYVLRILDTDRKILVPVKNASAVGLRPVLHRLRDDGAVRVEGKARATRYSAKT